MGGYSTRQQKVTTRIMNEAKWKSLEKTSRRLRSADKLIVWMVRIKSKVVFSTCEDLTDMPLKCDLCNMTNVMLEMLLSRCDVWALSTQTREMPSIQISTATAWAEIQTSLQTLKDCVCVCMCDRFKWDGGTLSHSPKPHWCFSGTEWLSCSCFLMWRCKM